ncbi:MAG: 4-hydroxy-3-methylbut-2-enyl diphosphate reductase [Clostridia bacterium]|nr:4-hydroxy-3-methylbut-2-enyl diphosphate reductase [Clostridia bacterium]
MLIYRGSTGFCAGVRNAVDTALAHKKDRVIYTLGNLIHNDCVIKSLEAVGVFAVFDVNSLNAKDTVVISSHGAPKKTVERLIEKGVKVIDATCPFVKKIHERVEKDCADGYGVVIIGDREHTEVKGIAGWCQDAQIITDEKEMDFSFSDKFSIVCQTTFDLDKYREIKKNIQLLATKLYKIVVFYDSICYTTVERQKEAVLLSSMSDAVLVLGDKSSSNTNKLVQIAKKKCNFVYLISNVSDLKSVQIQNISKLGLLSGASTPTELITEVINTMIETNNDTVIIEDVKESEALTQVEEQKTEVKKEKKEMSMKDAMKKYAPRQYREGMRLKGRVVSADNTGILVALDNAGKNDTGFIDKDEAEMEGAYSPENYKPDMELDVIIIPKGNDKNNKSINLSKKAYDALKVDDERVKGILAGDEFELSCTQEVKGGLLGKIGTYTVFVPASQIRMGFVQNLSEYLNKPLRLKALPPKDEPEESEDESKRPRNPKRIVASQRIVLEEEKAQREEDFWNSIPEGSVVSGKVKRFATFGAFVSLKYMDALVHNSELSWSRKKINSPDEVLTINTTYDFQVLSVDRENGKISLGYKQLQPKPEEIAMTKYPVGTITKGKVVRLVKFGAFVELEPGIDGLVHISQINHGWIKSANEALKVDDEVEVKVMGIENDRITLSIKELLPEEEVAQAPMFDINLGTDEEKPSRISQFNKRMEGQDRNDKRDRRKFRNEDGDEPREYISSSSVVTLADLFKQNEKIDD